MQYIPFIFSDKIPFRLARHILFWGGLYFGQASMMTLVPSLFNGLGDNTFKEYFFVPALYLPAQLFMVYSLLYYVIPCYVLTLQYKKALFATTGLVLLSAALAAVTFAVLFDKVRLHFYSFRMINYEPMSFMDNLPQGFVAGLRAVLDVAGFAAAIKLMKHWYEKEYRNIILQKEKLDAELQSLKAQLHPHFLFNTLNNIYSITENTAPLASDMLAKLSGLLRFILYDCDRPLVRLSQECRLIEDYIALEKIRYDHLDLTVRLPEGAGDYFIAPLLLLPLVENCFKHGASKVLDQPWIHIHAEIHENTLAVKLINGKNPFGETATFVPGIGFSNLQKRLALLYPGKHELSVIAEEDIFIVNCRVQLQKTPLSNG